MTTEDQAGGENRGGRRRARKIAIRVCMTVRVLRVPGDRNQPCSKLATYGPPDH